MKLGRQVGLGPGNIVLDGDPCSPPQRGTAPSPIFGPYLLRPNGCMDQDATWCAGRPRPRRLCCIVYPAPPPQKGDGPSTQIFGLCLLWPNGWMDHDHTWHGGRPQPSRLSPQLKFEGHRNSTV